MYLALTTLTIVTLLSLLIPMSTKISVDYIWTDKPGPAGIPEPLRSHLPQGRDRPPVGRVGITNGQRRGVSERHDRQRFMRRRDDPHHQSCLQVQVRKDAFEASPAPSRSTRIQHYKSGGMASLLPRRRRLHLRAALQHDLQPLARPSPSSIGTLFALAFIDWRMLVGSLLPGIPALWITPTTWIGKIRPMYRDTKLVRQVIDSTTTEAFGGMRVVRGALTASRPSRSASPPPSTTWPAWKSLSGGGAACWRPSGPS